MPRSITSVALASALVATIAPTTASMAGQWADDPCARGHIADVAVVAARDGRTFTTADGREVRLAGLEIPATDSGGRAALDALVAGKTVHLERLGQRPGQAEDRYGRVIAFAYVDTTSVQRALLRQGAAMVSSRAGTKACADTLFPVEAEARAAGRGLWADPELRPKSAANARDIAALKGRFVLVEGYILSVRTSGTTTYLNFAQPWWQGFSASILRRDARAFTAAGIALKQLQGKRIRVRGIVEMRRGPMIDAVRPEQIELIP
jgi:endonuclease YncB( thermonuclease family)